MNKIEDHHGYSKESWLNRDKNAEREAMRRIEGEKNGKEEN